MVKIHQEMQEKCNPRRHVTTPLTLQERMGRICTGLQKSGKLATNCENVDALDVLG